MILIDKRKQKWYRLAGICYIKLGLWEKAVYPLGRAEEYLTRGMVY